MYVQKDCTFYDLLNKPTVSMKLQFMSHLEIKHQSNLTDPLRDCKEVDSKQKFISVSFGCLIQD